MKQKVSFIFSTILLSIGLMAQTDTSRLSLLFAGDIMGHNTQIVAAYRDSLQTYDYAECFKFIKPVISKADLSFVNLEVTLAGEPYTGYPKFSSPDQLAVAVKNAGFDVVLNANNHACDRRKDGIIRTINVLDSLGIIHTGTFKNKMQKDSIYPLILEKNNIRLAILNYTYGTNGIPISYPVIVNLLDSVAIKKDLIKAKLLNPDKIIVITHWGTEYQNQQNLLQKRWYQFLKKNGADIVIGSHPHVIQPIEWYKEDDNLVAYSLGNFISNQRTTPRDGGLILKLYLEKIGNITYLKDVKYILSWVYRPKINGKYHFMILPVTQYEVMPSFFQYDSNSFEKMKNFINLGRTLLKDSAIEEEVAE